jgi:Domain of unknown function (DUF5666)
MEIRPEPVRLSRRIPVQMIIAAVLLAITVVAVGASLALPGESQTQPGLAAAAGASGAPVAAPDASVKPDRGASWGGWFPPGQMKRMQGTGGFGGGFLPDITISAINGNAVSLKSANGWTRTIDTTGVKITRAGTTINVGDLKVGDRISVSETRNSNGTYTVNQLTLVLDQVSGTVSKLDAGSITVTRPGGTSTIDTSASTVYRRAGQPISRSDIAVGQRVTAQGTTASDGSLAAETVDVQPDMVFGKVTAKSGSTLTVSTAGGGTATVQVTSSTTYQVAGKTNATLADVAVNDTIVAQGVLGTNGVLTASTVRAGSGKFAQPFVKGNGNPHWKNAVPSPAATGTSG